ncbi:MAG: CinA family protein [Chitinophagaceae bacterium]|nr:CinA family protein [Chitinophagaceae bacterium]
MIFPKQTLDQIRDILVERKQTVAVAESVTSGLLQAAFSNATDAALFFQGGITAYNLGQKCRHLCVEPIHALDCDCVSEKVSVQMATEVCRLFTSHYGIGITGYATPIPEKKVTELFAHLCIVHNGTIMLAKKIDPADKTALDAQLHFTGTVMDEFLKTLQVSTHHVDREPYTFV